ncbi:MAG: class I SAM-dependent methyltransferase [Chloroflexia bacterium]
MPDPPINSDDPYPLLDWICERIRERGPVTVAQFMEWALYHEQLGYYSRGPQIGPRGDFTTSPEASTAFGRLLANHLFDIDALLGHPAHFHVIECGPGLGTLAKDLLDELSSSRPDVYARTRYWLVEISPGLTAAQQTLLSPEHGGVARWARSLDEMPEGVDGALLANEVVDAFPVHVLENRGGLIMEHYVEAAPGAELRIGYGPPSRPELMTFLDKYGIDLKPGQRLEVNLAARRWVGQVRRALGRGLATIIDYGDTSPTRYSEARREGTLLGYYGGAVTDNILARPGGQDLTALVDFTALQDAAAEEGLSTVALTRQANFLLGLGLGTAVTAESVGGDLAAVLRNRRGLQALISPEGLGRFHVLVLSHGLDPDTARAGLSGLMYAEVS